MRMGSHWFWDAVNHFLVVCDRYKKPVLPPTTILPSSQTFCYVRTVGTNLLIFLLEPAKKAHLSTGNAILKCKRRLQMLLRCCKTLSKHMRKVWKVCSAAYHHFTHHASSKSLEWIGWFLRPSHPTRCTHARQKLCLLIRSDNHCFWDVANPFPYVCGRSEKLPMQTTNYHAPCCIVIIRIKLAQFSARANQEGSLEHSRSGSCNEDGQSLVLRCCKPLPSCMWQV